MLRRKLKDSEKEIERLKEQAQQYVSKVKEAEQLLLQKVCYFFFFNHDFQLESIEMLFFNLQF